MPLALTATDIASLLTSGVNNVTPVLRKWYEQGLARVAGAEDRPPGLPPVRQGGAIHYRLEPPLAELVIRTRAMATRGMYTGESEQYSFSGRMRSLFAGQHARDAMVWILMHPGRLATSAEIAEGVKLPILAGQRAIGLLREHGLVQRYGDRRTDVVYGIDPEIRRRLSVAVTGHSSVDWTVKMAVHAVNILSDLVNAATGEHRVVASLLPMIIASWRQRLEAGILTELDDPRRIQILMTVVADRGLLASSTIAQSLSVKVADLGHQPEGLAVARLLFRVDSDDGIRYGAPDGLDELISAYQTVNQIILVHEQRGHGLVQ